MLSITFRNQSSELARLPQALTAFGRQHGLSARTVHDLNLVLEEILVNIISYAYADDRAHDIHVRLGVQSGVIRVDVEDDGRPFNPLEMPTPDTTKALGERAIGGLGILFVRTLMDGLEYRREGERNLLTLSKKIQEAQAHGH